MKETTIYKTSFSYCGGYLGTSEFFNTREEQIAFESKYKNDTMETNKNFISYEITTTKRFFKKNTTVKTISEWWER